MTEQRIQLGVSGPVLTFSEVGQKATDDCDNCQGEGTYPACRDSEYCSCDYGSEFSVCDCVYKNLGLR